MRAKNQEERNISIKPMLLGFTIPWEIATIYFEVDNSPAIQTHKFGWSVARSLKHAFDDVWLFSACPVQNYPLNAHVIFRSFEFRESGVGGVSMGFVNLLVLKHLSRFFSCALRTKEILLDRKINTVFIHGVHFPFLLYGFILRVFGIRVVAILTDPAGVFLPTDGFLSKALKVIDRTLVNSILSRFKFVIAVSEGLLGRVAVGCKTLVLPGILSQEWLELVEAARPPLAKERKRVLYAGGISNVYGIGLILEAADLLPEIDFYIFGKADSEFQANFQRRNNIYYGGFVSSSELLSEMLDSDILINPRFSKADFATKSFPSKLIEYMASGKTVLTTRINGIPDDLINFLHFIEDESASGVAEAVRAITNMDANEVECMAKAGKKAVIGGYSEQKVSMLIKNLLES